MSNSSPTPKYRFRFLQFFLLFLIAECPYIDLLVWVLYFLISPRLYLKWRWNSGIYENVTLTNTNAIFFFLVLLISWKLYWIEFYSQGPRKGRGWEGGGQGLPTFWKKKKIKKYTFSNKRNLWWNKNIRLADLARASKFMIGPFRSCITMASFKVTISTKLHLVVDFCVFTSQVM